MAIALPPMGCGTWAWGNRFLWGYDPAMDGELQRVFDRCVAAGVTLFDTGDSYGTGRLQGRSESLLGQFAARSSDRDRLCLATKLAPYPWRWTRRSLAQAAQASAQRLGGRIDLAQLHWSTANYAPWQERGLLLGLGDLLERGEVGAIGLSNFGPQRLKQIYPLLGDRGLKIATLQVQYSLLSTYPMTELGLMETCQELGIRVIAYSPLALGLLTGKYGGDRPLPPGPRGALFRQLLPQMQPLLEVLGAIAQERQKTISQVALNWCMAKGTIPIPGAKTLAQAEENIGALGWSLDGGEVAALDEQAAKAKPMVQNIFQTR